jgi:hypothetical protein
MRKSAVDDRDAVKPGHVSQGLHVVIAYYIYM